jgi:hypothetical protein
VIVGTYTQLVGHYPVSLLGIPVLGLEVSTHAFLRVNVSRRQDPLRQALQDSRMEAFRTVVNVPPPFPSSGCGHLGRTNRGGRLDGHGRGRRRKDQRRRDIGAPPSAAVPPLVVQASMDPNVVQNALSSSGTLC